MPCLRYDCERRADTIIDYQWRKASRSRSYFSEKRSKDSDEIVTADDMKSLVTSSFPIHPRHEKQMRPHQLAGFHFLVKNIVSDKPGGCILAHAPSSGKTFIC
uniref:SNF2 N-terminal domain-containing protein n=1 Tax=Aegilops tauschii subsp. strangulata TaxID=200361 RepID=A0A453LDW7_AEGTS